MPLLDLDRGLVKTNRLFAVIICNTLSILSVFFKKKNICEFFKVKGV